MGCGNRNDERSWNTAPERPACLTLGMPDRDDQPAPGLEVGASRWPWSTPTSGIGHLTQAPSAFVVRTCLAGSPAQ